METFWFLKYNDYDLSEYIRGRDFENLSEYEY